MSEPLLLVPGMMCDARLFGPQVAALGARHTLHLAAPPLAPTIAGMAEDILTSAPPRFALAGLSMGGIVAMEIVAQAPDRVARLALLDTNYRAESSAARDGREALIARVEAGGLEALMRDEVIPTYFHDPSADALRALALDMALEVGPAAFVAQSRALQSRADHEATLRDLTVPALVLCGEADRVCPPHRHETMAALIPGARLEIVAGAGHLPTLERPAETTAALARWLSA